MIVPRTRQYGSVSSPGEKKWTSEIDEQLILVSLVDIARKRTHSAFSAKLPGIRNENYQRHYSLLNILILALCQS